MGIRDPFQDVLNKFLGGGSATAQETITPEEKEKREKAKAYRSLVEEFESPHQEEKGKFDRTEVSSEPLTYKVKLGSDKEMVVEVNAPHPKNYPGFDRLRATITVQEDGKTFARREVMTGYKADGGVSDLPDTVAFAFLDEVKAAEEKKKYEHPVGSTITEYAILGEISPDRRILNNLKESSTGKGAYYGVTSSELPNEAIPLPKRNERGDDRFSVIVTDRAMIDISRKTYGGAGVNDALAFYFPKLKGGIDTSSTTEKVNIFSDMVFLPGDFPESKWQDMYRALKQGLRQKEDGTYEIDPNGTKGATSKEFHAYLQQEAPAVNGDFRQFLEK